MLRIDWWRNSEKLINDLSSKKLFEIQIHLRKARYCQYVFLEPNYNYIVRLSTFTGGVLSQSHCSDPRCAVLRIQILPSGLVE